MTCHICIKTGERTCSPEEAEIKCMICGRCAAEAELAKQQGGNNDGQ